MPHRTSTETPRQKNPARQDEFVKSLIENLLEYALGRSLTFADQTLVEELTTTSRTRDYRLQDLLTSIITSNAFRSK